MRFGLRTQFLQQLPQNLKKIRLENEHENISANGFHHGELPFFRAFLLNKTDSGFWHGGNRESRLSNSFHGRITCGGWLDSQELIVDSPDLSERNNDFILGETPWCFLNRPSPAPLNDLSLSSKSQQKTIDIESVDSKLASSWTQRFRIF